MVGWVPRSDGSGFHTAEWGVWVRNKNLVALFVGAMLTVLGGCAGTGATTEFAGVPSVTSGSCPELVDQGHGLRSVLTIRSGAVLFTPGDGVVQLSGMLDATGHIIASRNAVGSDHHAFDMVFDGKLAEGVVTGAFATPRCRATVRMSAT